MTQYHSHTPGDTQLHGTVSPDLSQTREIFLEFHTTKAVRAQAERQDRELRERIANAERTAVGAGSAPKRRRPLGEARIERDNQWAELIQRETTSILLRCIT